MPIVRPEDLIVAERFAAQNDNGGNGGGGGGGNQPPPNNSLLFAAQNGAPRWWIEAQYNNPNFENDIPAGFYPSQTENGDPSGDPRRTGVNAPGYKAPSQAGLIDGKYDPGRAVQGINAGALQSAIDLYGLSTTVTEILGIANAQGKDAAIAFLQQKLLESRAPAQAPPPPPPPPLPPPPGGDGGPGDAPGDDGPGDGGVETDFAPGAQYPAGDGPGGQPSGSIPLGYHWVQTHTGWWVLEPDGPGDAGDTPVAGAQNAGDLFNQIFGEGSVGLTPGPGVNIAIRQLEAFAEQGDPIAHDMAVLLQHYNEGRLDWAQVQQVWGNAISQFGNYNQESPVGTNVGPGSGAPNTSIQTDEFGNVAPIDVGGGLSLTVQPQTGQVNPYASTAYKGGAYGGNASGNLFGPSTIDFNQVDKFLSLGGTIEPGEIVVTGEFQPELMANIGDTPAHVVPLSGLSLENMVDFAKTPAGRSVMARLNGLLNG